MEHLVLSFTDDGSLQVEEKQEARPAKWIAWGVLLGLGRRNFIKLLADKQKIS